MVLLFWPGSKGPNRYGRNPKERAEDYAEAVFGENYDNGYYQQRAVEAPGLLEPEPKVRPYAAPARDISPTGSKGTKLRVVRKSED